jgi:hypothetical protein
MKTARKNNSLLTTYNLSRTVNFTTRTQNNSSTAIDIFVDNTRLNSSLTSHIINGLLDSDGQFITIINIATTAILIPVR